MLHFFNASLPGRLQLQTWPYGFGLCPWQRTWDYQVLCSDATLMSLQLVDAIDSQWFQLTNKDIGTWSALEPGLLHSLFSLPGPAQYRPPLWNLPWLPQAQVTLFSLVLQQCCSSFVIYRLMQWSQVVKQMNQILHAEVFCLAHSALSKK